MACCASSEETGHNSSFLVTTSISSLGFEFTSVNVSYSSGFAVYEEGKKKPTQYYTSVSQWAKNC